MTTEADDVGAQVRAQRAAVDEARAMELVALDLHVEFPSVPIDQVTVVVQCLWSHFDGAPIREFVPVLVMRQAREELLHHVGLLHG
ncbi:MAG: hypothetical protein ABW075_10500 [Aeromicrobium sp.]